MDDYTIHENRYKYHIVNNDSMKRVICISRYAGVYYRGVATCSPDDTFDVAVGMKLARLRCDRKINKVKNKYIDQRLLETNVLLAAVQKELYALGCIKVKYMKDDFRTEDEFRAMDV